MNKVKLTDGSLESWATEAELISTAFHYDLDIFVKTKINDRSEWQKYPPGECTHKKDFVCLNFSSNHFDYCKTSVRPCSCSSVQLKVKEEEVLDLADTSNIPPIETIEINETKESNSIKEKEVINLSSKKLTKQQLSLLGKGLKFIPTKKNIDFTQLLTDLKTWERRMRLREYFFDNESNNESFDTQEKITIGKSKTWTPEEGRDKWLDEYIRQVKEDVIRGLKRNFSSNITRAEEKAMKELLTDQSIVIRPADKGSGIVIMDTDKYVDQVEKEMINSTSYCEVKDDKSKQITNKIKKLINEMHKKGSISSELRQYLLPTQITSGKLQANPKIHKNNNPLRTIVNGRQHPTEKIAEYVESQL